MPIRATRPYRGHADAGPKGVSWGSAIRTRTSSFKGYRAAWLPDSPSEPFPRVELGHRPYRGRLDAGPKGTVRSAGLEPAPSTSSTWPLCRWSTSAWSRHPVPNRITGLTKARPQPCVTARAVEAVLPGQVSNLHCGGQGPVACQLADPASSAEDAIRTRTGRAAYQLLRMACLPFHHFRIVRHQGFEPRTISLRGCCSDH